MPLFYGTGTGLCKFEDNSTELFTRVTVKVAAEDRSATNRK